MPAAVVKDGTVTPKFRQGKISPPFLTAKFSPRNSPLAKFPPPLYLAHSSVLHFIAKGQGAEKTETAAENPRCEQLIWYAHVVQCWTEAGHFLGFGPMPPPPPKKYCWRVGDGKGGGLVVTSSQKMHIRCTRPTITTPTQGAPSSLTSPYPSLNPELCSYLVTACRPSALPFLVPSVGEIKVATSPLPYGVPSVGRNQSDFLWFRWTIKSLWQPWTPETSTSIN